MIGKLTAGLLLACALVNLAPVIGVQSGEALARLYGIAAPTGDELLLLRHRALLFGIVGGLLAAAVVAPSLRPAAVVAGLVSMIGFIVLAGGGGHGEAVVRVVRIDVVASALLVLAGGLEVARVARSVSS